MGLLNRAKDSQSEIENNIWNHLFSKVDSLDAGIDFAAVLFRYLTEYLEIEKAALFLSSDNFSSYNCLQSKGYDKTTTNRLRLDNKVFDSDVFSILKMQNKPLCSAEVPSFLKDYMSTREFGLLEEIYWLPFFIEENLFSVIMITQWTNFVAENWNESFRIISSRYSKKIYNSRKALVVNTEDSARKPQKEVIESALRRYDGKDITIIKINLLPLVNLLSRIKDGLSHLNIKKEVLSVFRTMAGPQQEILEVENNQILLFLDNIRIPDKSLFLHQLSASLPLLFQDLDEPPHLDVIEYANPLNEIERDELLRVLL